MRLGDCNAFQMPSQESFSRKSKLISRSCLILKISMIDDDGGGDGGGYIKIIKLYS